MPGKMTSPTIRETLANAAKSLQPTRITCAADKHLGELEAEILLAYVLKCDRSWLFAHPSFELRAPSYRRFLSLLARRKNHEPIAYIVGEKEFYGLPYFVNRHVLIPRPDSELLVELARQRLFPEPSMHDLVWDVGTGSGAVAIAIAKHIAPRNVLATDISSRALVVARRNAKRNRVKHITFLKANLLDAPVRRRLASASRLILVANLPYLPASDVKKLEPDVVNYEPSGALFVGKDGTDLIEKLLRQLAAFDIHFASAFFEFDPPQTKKLRRLAKIFFPRATVTIHKDLARRNRVLEISLVR